MSFKSEQIIERINSAEQIIRNITDFTMVLIDDIAQDNEELKKRLITLFLDKVTKSNIENNEELPK